MVFFLALFQQVLLAIESKPYVYLIFSFNFKFSIIYHVLHGN